MKQFDLPKAKAGEALTTAAQALSTLSGDIESEEALMGGDMAQDCDVDDDNMSSEELDELDKTLQPVRLVLVKVHLFWSLNILPHLTHFPSCANSLTPSRIPLPLFFQSGHQF